VKLQLNILLIFFTFFCFKLDAQTYKTVWSKKLKQKSGYALENILVAYNNFTILHKKNQNVSINSNFKHKLEKYNSKFNLTKSIDVSKKINKYKKSIEKIFSIKSNVFVLSMDRKVSVKTKNLFLYKVANDNFTLNFNIKPVKSITVQNYNLDYNFQIVESKNQKKFAIIYDLTAKEKDNYKLGFLLFDDDGNLLNDEIINIPYKKINVEFVDAVISNDGELFLCFDNFRKSFKVKYLKNKVPNYKTIIVKFFDKKLNEIDVENDNKLISDYKLFFDDYDLISICGFFGKNDVARLNGIFIKKFDTESLFEITSVFNEFELNTITQNTNFRESKRAIKKYNKQNNIELLNFYITDLIVKSNNETVIIIEQFYNIEDELISIANANFNNNLNTEIEYIFKEILVFNFNDGGNFNWSYKIPKNQKLPIRDVDFASYQHHLQDDNIYIVFNDNEKNFNLDFTEKYVNSFYVSNKMNTIVYRIDENGKAIKKKLFDAKNAEVFIKPSFSETIDEEGFLIYGVKNKFQRLGKVVLSE